MDNLVKSGKFYAGMPRPMPMGSGMRHGGGGGGGGDFGRLDRLMIWMTMLTLKRSPRAWRSPFRERLRPFPTSLRLKSAELLRFPETSRPS